jgi:hypothetical protein
VQSNLTSSGVLLGQGTGAIQATAAGANGAVFIGANGTNPRFASFTSTGNTLAFTTGPGSLNIDLIAPLSVSLGGTGTTSFALGGLLIGQGTAPLTSQALGMQQLLIGQGTNQNPVAATLTAGTNIGIGTSSGAITISSTTIAFRNDSSTSITPALSDAGYLIRTTSGTAVSFTVPNDSSVAYPTGTVLMICQAGNGAVTVSPQSPVTLNAASGYLKIQGQYAAVSLTKVGSNTWDLVGNLTS